MHRRRRRLTARRCTSTVAKLPSKCILDCILNHPTVIAQNSRVKRLVIRNELTTARTLLALKTSLKELEGRLATRDFSCIVIQVLACVGGKLNRSTVVAPCLIRVLGILVRDQFVVHAVVHKHRSIGGILSAHSLFANSITIGRRAKQILVPLQQLVPVRTIALGKRRRQNIRVDIFIHNRSQAVAACKVKCSMAFTGQVTVSFFLQVRVSIHETRQARNTVTRKLGVGDVIQQRRNVGGCTTQCPTHHVELRGIRIPK